MTGQNMGSGFESHDLAGEILDIEDLDESDFDCLACEDGGIVLHGRNRGDLCTCRMASALENDADMSDVEADADTFSSCGWGTDEDYGDFGNSSEW